MIKTFIKNRLADLMLDLVIPRQKNVFIACHGKQDGMGAQVHAVFSAMLYAAATRTEYVHSPLTKVTHNYERDTAYPERIESFFSLGLHERTTWPAEARTINLDRLGDVFRYIFYAQISRCPTVFLKQHFHRYADRSPDKYALIQSSLREKFYAQPKRHPLHSSPSCLCIAVHIRRGDVHENSVRFTGNAQLKCRIGQLTDTLQQLGIPYEVHFYSQGTREEFHDFDALGSLHLGGNVFEDYYNLVRSDVLFIAKSSYSYTAALLSEAIIVYEPFWHSPMSSWLIWKNGLFSRPEVQSRLLEHTRRVTKM